MKGNKMYKQILGIDIGGSHITSALVDMEERAVIEDSLNRKFINSMGSAQEILEAWCAVIDNYFKQPGAFSGKIGIAMPGPFDYEKGISYMQHTEKYEALYGLNVKEMLAERLGIRPEDIAMQNDAACYLQGEVYGGAARGYKKAIGITLGTGLGTSSFADGLARDEKLWKHGFLDGIAEDYISTRWFLKRYFQLTGINVLNVKKLAEMYDSSATTRDIFKEFAGNLANFIMEFLDMTDSEVVVIGGNIANASEKFLPEVVKKMRESGYHVPVYIASLKENAAIIGAACHKQLLML